MTIDGFLGLLDPEGWHVDTDGFLVDENDDCPLWHAYRNQQEWQDEDAAECHIQAGTRLGLLEEDALAIAQAADNKGQPELRQRLLTHLGLGG